MAVDRDLVFAALLDQESGRGKNIVGQPTKWGRALGIGQTLPATAEAMAGKIGLTWDPTLLTKTTPEALDYQAKLARAYFDESVDASNGDIQQGLMRYHGGPNQKLWGPKTRAYAGNIVNNVQSGRVTPYNASDAGSPQAINDTLATMTQEEQDNFLNSLPTNKLDEYATWAQKNNPSSKGPQVVTPVGGHTFSHAAPSSEPSDLELQSMSDEQLAKLAGESEQPEKSGWLNTAGLTARAAVKGVAGLPLAIFDKVAEVPGLEGTQNAATGFVDSKMDDAGLARPETSGQRVYSDIISGMTGAAATGGGGALLSKAPGALGRFGSVTASNPVGQMVSGGLGGAAAGVTREEGGSPGEQVLAAMVGSLSPQMAGYAGGGAIRRALRGGADGLQTMKDNIDTFERAGTFPSVGEATGGEKTRETEAFLSRLFGSSGTMRRFAAKQEEDIGKAIQQRSEALAPGGSNITEAGNKVVGEVENNFLPNARAIVDNKFDVLEKHLPKSTVVPPSNFRKALQEEVATIPGASNLSTNKQLAGDRDGWVSVLQDLDKDVKTNLQLGQGQGIPYEAIKGIRTTLGKQLEKAAFDVNVDTAKVKHLYGALSEDMKAAAANAGPKAEKAFADANAASQELHAHLDLIKPALDRKGGGEAVFQSIMSGSPEGATKLKAVYDSIRKDARHYLSSAIIDRMSRSAPGTGLTQGEFNLQTFFKNYENLARSPEALNQVFGRMPGGMKKDFDAIAKTAFTIREGREEFGAASKASEGRTGLQAILYPMIAGPALAAGGAISGNGAAGVGSAAMLAGGTAAFFGGGKYVAGKLTDPKFVKWLAQTNKIPRSSLPVAINQLAQQARRDHDSDMLRASEELQNMTEDQANAF